MNDLAERASYRIGPYDNCPLLRYLKGSSVISNLSFTAKELYFYLIDSLAYWESYFCKCCVYDKFSSSIRCHACNYSGLGDDVQVNGVCKHCHERTGLN